MTNKPTVTQAMLCAGGAAVLKTAHLTGCERARIIYLAMVASTPQEPDDDALIALDRLLRMTVPVPAGCVGAEGEPMSPGFVVSIQLVTDEGVHFIIRASGHSSDTLDLVATPRRLALLAPFEAGETREERIARTVAAPNPPYSGIVDEADFTRGEE